MLHWIAWNRTVLTSILCTYAKLSEIIQFWQLNFVLMLNWIAWNRIDDLFKNEFGIE